MKKLLTTLALFAALTLTACGGKPAEGESKPADATSQKAPSSKHEHTFDESTWASNETQHWHPATCEHTSQKGSVAAHDFEEVTAEYVEPTCSIPGKKVEVCKVCKYRKETTLTAEHDYQDYTVEHVKADDEVAMTYKKCSRDNHYKFSFDAKDAAKVASSNSYTGKLTNMGDNVTYKFYSPFAMKARVWVDMTFKTSQWWSRENPDNASQALWYDYKEEDSGAPGFKFKLWFNGTEDANLVDQDAYTYPVDGLDIKMSELVYNDFGANDGDAAICAWVELNLVAGTNSIKIERAAGYCPTFVNFFFEGDYTPAA